MKYKFRAEQLSSEAFRPYGEVVEPKGEFKIINNGMSKKWDNLINPYITPKGNEGINLGILMSKKSGTVFTEMERHFHTSQVFIPLISKRFLVVVAPPADDLNPVNVRAFIGKENQGVCLYPRTWHCPLVPLDADMEFVSIMKYSKVPDVERFSLSDQITVIT